MIDLDFLQTLIRAIDESSLDSIEIERGGTRVRLSKTPDVTAAPPLAHASHAHAPAPSHAAPAPSAEGAPATSHATGPEDGGAAAAAREREAEDAAARENLVEITSPMVGTFYRAPAPDAPAYVDEGDRISTGDTLCIIEAMKLMNELEAEVAGRVVEILVDNAEPVEYGQVLFRIDPV